MIKKRKKLWHCPFKVFIFLTDIQTLSLLNFNFILFHRFYKFNGNLYYFETESNRQRFEILILDISSQYLIFFIISKNLFWVNGVKVCIFCERFVIENLYLSKNKFTWSKTSSLLRILISSKLEKTYLLSLDNSYTWKQGHFDCTTMFLGYSRYSSNLASFHTKEEYDFIK